MLDLDTLFLLMGYFERLYNNLFRLVVKVIRVLLETAIDRLDRCGCLSFKSRVYRHHFTTVFLHNRLVLGLYLLINQAIDHILIQKLGSDVGRHHQGSSYLLSCLLAK